MFPRRRPPRGLPIRRRPPMQNKAQQILQRAHRLMEEGKYAQAAEIFERLARGAKQRGMLKQAPSLFLQAGKANVLDGDVDQGADFIRQGLKMLARARRWPALQRVGNRVVKELTAEGHTDLVQEFEDWLSETLPDDFEEMRDPRDGRRAKLPLKCPSCGGPIRSDEVEWVDRTTAVCPYCGSGLRDGED